MSKLKVIFLIGPPTSGKATQSAFLAHECGWIHIPAADVLKEAKDPIAAVKRVLLEHATSGNHRFLIPGFPCNLDQLDAWQRTLGSYVDVACAVLIDCPYDVAVKRLPEPYPLEAWQQSYAAVASVCKCFDGQGKLRKVSGVGSIEEVTRKLLRALNDVFGQQRLARHSARPSAIVTSHLSASSPPHSPRSPSASPSASASTRPLLASSRPDGPASRGREREDVKRAFSRGLAEALSRLEQKQTVNGEAATSDRKKGRQWWDLSTKEQQSLALSLVRENVFDPMLQDTLGGGRVGWRVTRDVVWGGYTVTATHGDAARRSRTASAYVNAYGVLERWEGEGQGQGERTGDGSEADGPGCRVS